MATLPLRGTSLGNPDETADIAIARGGKNPEHIRRYDQRLWWRCAQLGIRADVAHAQADVETGHREKGIGFQSDRWIDEGNPAGLGIVTNMPDSEEGRVYSPEEWADIHAAHLAGYAGIDPGPELRTLDFRWDAMIRAGYFGIAKTVDDLDERWAEDPGNYGDKIAARHALYRFAEQEPYTPPGDGTGGPQNGGTDMVAMKAHNFPGARRSMYLPTALQVQVGIVNHSRVRSFQKFTGQRYSTVHDTGNPRTKAPAEYSWLAGGRSGAGAGGYQGIVDDVILYIAGVFDEVTWAQGTADGNRLSWALELAYGGNTDWNKALDNACAVHGAFLEHADLSVQEALVQHQKWYGKWCSAQILNRGLVSFVINRVQYWWNQARAARTGVTPQPQPQEWAEPILPVMANGEPWDGAADLVTSTGVKFEAQRLKAKILGDVNQRQWGNTESLFTGPGYKAGTEVEFLGWIQGEIVNGISEWWIDTEGSRVWAGAVDAEPKEDPDYGKHPELPPGVVPVNGRLYYPLNDEETGELGRRITAHSATDLYKWADTSSEVVGSMQDGEERVFRYWTRGQSLPLSEDGPEEMIWYAEDVFEGARMWSGMSEERPD